MLTLLLATIVTFERPGPGVINLCDNGIVIDNFNFPVTIPRVNGHVTKVEFQRIGPGQCLSLDYRLENVSQAYLPNTLHIWRDRQFWSIEPFDGFNPIFRNRLNDSPEPIGWTYIHQDNLSPFDGRVDFDGPSGYQGHIAGVTSVDAWTLCTNPAKTKLFEGSGNVTINFSPRFQETIFGVPHGHWGTWGTDWNENITLLRIRVTYE